MPIVVYDLAGKDDRRFSPFCWRTLMALAHKGLAADFKAWHFTEKDKIAFTGQGRVPVMVDNDKQLFDSWTIACYLEDRYPERPSLFNGDAGRALARFVQHFVDSAAQPGLARLIIADVHRHLVPQDQDYFRKTREERFGAKLEDVQTGRDKNVVGWRASLEPVRLQLRERAYMAGEAPSYADYTVFGMFAWARGISPFKLLDRDDPLFAWRDRMMALHGGIALQVPGYSLAA